MTKRICSILFLLLLSGSGYLSLAVQAQPAPEHNLQFSFLAQKWDEAMPLGNGMLGALVWQKQGRLRLSLDRADLWDERKALDLSKFNFADVQRWVQTKKYDSAHRLGDAPYNQSPYPTKLPAAATEFDIDALGKVVSNVLDIRTALNTVTFSSGVIFKCYIHATKNAGYFSFENLPAKKIESLSRQLTPQLVVHNYANGNNIVDKDRGPDAQGLQKLGYKKGTVTRTGTLISYRQPTYGGHYYDVRIQWNVLPGNKIAGSWAIGNDQPAPQAAQPDNTGTWAAHVNWWKQFWAKSSIRIPDALIEKQYYLEMYKLGAASRPDAPAITLQAVWTADNGSLPPWKGDFHNDLNTQLSYWPVYTGNHLAEGESFINWLWNQRSRNKTYTKQYFGVEGLNTPGVATIKGDPMGGWIQYSLSPTVVAWCAQHFYWHWKYSMDEQFLKAKAYTYITEGATYLQNITRLVNGVRMLPLSSSPEYNDNRIDAWFTSWSNFDLALAKFLFTAASEVAAAVGKGTEASHWRQLLNQLPGYEVNETGFTVAPGQNLNSSHRHMSPYMAVYPLGLLDYNNPADQVNIKNSLQRIEKIGTRGWCGYSFSWMASLYARAYEADKAVQQLQIFASNFCSPNSFHLNGDQKGGQYSGFTYRPFTLEGNFAFAQGVHELLLQSRNGYIEVFPAVPASWKNVAFSNLRTEGAFIVSAKKEAGSLSAITIRAEKGGVLNIRLPFENWRCKGISRQAFTAKPNGVFSATLKKGQVIVINQ
ncbi:glycosyl hydrolase family 95 catalytic domain-containing protein [Niabella hirudinis]|uniref:glycosyl hydrolase family 95 catalytic domain-containing protein n=1 Tax=Niabella hirudinis TaxID=1285929 RepID=UPI003EB9663F